MDWLKQQREGRPDKVVMVGNKYYAFKEKDGPIHAIAKVFLSGGKTICIISCCQKLFALGSTHTVEFFGRYGGDLFFNANPVPMLDLEEIDCPDCRRGIMDALLEKAKALKKEGE